jgi:galactokinase
MPDIRRQFDALFTPSNDAFTVVAPGRVNLIGEHVDYNDGFVLPMAIPLSLELRIQPRPDRTIRLFSTNFEEEKQFSLDNIERQNSWIDYLQGVAHELAGASVPLHGFEGVISSEVPVASGLSSSAAVEVAAGLAFLHLAEQPLSPSDLALLCQRAENKFMGVNSGIMDQMAVAACHRDHALLLDCRSLQCEQIPLRLQDHSIVVTDSAAPRELAGSAYNERRAQCEAGLLLLQQHLPHAISLRDVTPEELAPLSDALPAVVRRRVRHVVDEIARTQLAVGLLRKDDFIGFGRCMHASHVSLRDLYQVSSAELDWLVQWALQRPGVLGSRMTGAGFGGCIVSLMEIDAVEAFMQDLPPAYQEAHGREARSWVCTAVEGAHLLE